MDQDKVVEFRIPGAFQDDPLTAVLRDGARRLLAQAVEAEVAAFLAQHADQVTAEGHRRVVRNGYLPERTIQTGIGAVPVRQPRVRDRGAAPGEARSASPLPCCRATCGAPARWRICCRGCT